MCRGCAHWIQKVLFLLLLPYLSFVFCILDLEDGARMTLVTVIEVVFQVVFGKGDEKTILGFLILPFVWVFFLGGGVGVWGLCVLLWVLAESEQMEKRKMEDGVGVETEKVVESDEKEDEKAMGSDENEDDFFDEEDYDYGSHDGESGGVSEEEEEGKEMDKGRDSSMSEEGERQSDLETVCQNLYSELATYGGSGLQSMMMWMSAKIKSQLLAMAPEESSWSASLISQCEKHAETMVEKLDAERYKLQRSLEEVENSQVENLTSSDAFRGLALKPIKNSIAQYEYELQIFQRVKQFERGSSIGSLGEWSHFDGDKQLYTNGATCWQGPRRSTTVEFVCGDETEILDVQEVSNLPAPHLPSLAPLKAHPT